MCGRFSQFSEVETIASAFGAASAGLETRAMYNLAPTTDALVIREGNGDRRLERWRWGLVPFWAKDPAMGARLINARVETVAEKPSFRSAFKQRRCLVPADGYFEWTGPKGQRQPWYIQAAGDDTLLAFAGLWERWQPEPSAPALYTFTIITTGATGPTAELHHRMPLLVTGDDISAWLNPDNTDPGALLDGMRDAATKVSLATHLVSPVMNSASYNRADCLAPLEPGA